MDYSNKWEVKISIEGYLREILEYFPDEITGIAKTPEATYLSKVQSDENQILMDDKQA